MRDPRDYEIIRVCGYCGQEYGGRLGCCGESYMHAKYWTDCPGLEDEDFATPEDCFRAIEDACRDANIALAESLEDRNA